MGGAERSARKRRQQQQRGQRVVAQARGAGNGRRQVIIVVIAVVVVAAAVIGGVIWYNASKNDTAGKSIAPQTSPSQPPAAGVVEKRDGVVVTAGKPTAKATIDIYADFLCPYCKQLQDGYGAQIEQLANAGVLRVNYHMVTLLNDRSDPPGYSLLAANAALAAADDGKFTAFHDSLFAQQPGEGKRGYDANQLIQLGRSLGITDPAFAAKVTAGTYDSQLQAAFAQVEKDPALQQTDPQSGQRYFGTPTVTSDGKIVNTQNPTWLTDIVSAKG